jgi:AraC-like DNA-binding protein
MTTELLSDIFTFVQKVQTLALARLEPDPVRRLSTLWSVLQEVPCCDRDEDRVVLSMIIRRVADAGFHRDHSREVPPEVRLRRARVRDVHTARALACVREQFMDPAIDLRAVAARCRLSAPYLSHLLSTSTGYGFHTHISWLRVLHAAYLLGNTTLSIAEVAYRSGFGGTTALDHEFKKRLHLTPGEFRRWA